MALRNLLSHFTTKRPLLPPFSSLYNRTFAANMADDTSPKAVKVVSFDTVKGVTSDPKLILIDVREPSELKEDGKIPNSVNVPLGEVGDAFKLHSSSFTSKYGIPKPDAEANLVVSCKSGKRASNAYQVLRGLGYQNVSLYSGSFLDWVKNGGPIVK
ncbi:hypothetical protein JTE90_003020 [Oedothorax gibbosus]|uniref:Rhodanese domain-containing protein n=1 Tax=Oedothorax gibbosus TaxID=931172 RepID=A0AAV6VDS3_9ARAC|nr:hypothetical protein JTE90_003020 [Oedothorax gibbosus]